MYKSIATALIATVGALGAGVAQAGNVSWSIGINTPVIGTVVSNVPVYGPEPVYYSEPVYAQAPVYVRAPREYVQAPPVYVQAPVPVYQPAPQVGYYPRHAAYYRPIPVPYPHYYAERHHGHPHWKDRGWRQD
jgi:hypothetical protein